MSYKAEIKEKIRRLTDLSSNPVLKPVFDATAKVLPNTSKNESETRANDRAAVARGELGAPVEHEPGLIDGRLNRNKILMGTALFYNEKNITPKDFEYIRDAGFDLLVTVTDGDFRDFLLNECEKNNIAVIAKDESLPGGPELKGVDLTDESIFAAYNKYPAQVGDTGWDEPNAADIGYIADYTRLYKKALPGQFLFNNLFPDGATKKQLGAKSYRDYVNIYADAVDTDYISLDIYPFYFSSLLNRVGLKLCLNTYDCVADACRRKGRDFWLYTQTKGLWYSHLYLLVTFEQIKWQVYTSLAYGARCILQVDYTPVWDKDAYAMTDKQGNLTEQYLYAKRINAEIQKLSPVLTPYRSLGVLPSKAMKENPDFSLALKQQKESSAWQGFTGIDEVKAVYSESTALVGYFEKEDKSAKGLMIVNCRDLFDSGASQGVKIVLTRPCKVKVYQKGEKIGEKTIRESFEVHPDSCDGIFITLE